MVEDAVVGTEEGAVRVLVADVVAPMRPGEVAKTTIAVWKADAASEFREHLKEVQARFVDEPVAAVSQAQSLVADAVRALLNYSWPGNVRELENEIHRLVLCVPPGRRIARRHLAPHIRDVEPVPEEPLARILARVELALIRQRLQQKSTKSAAARSLGITREALYAKMKRLGM